MPDTPTARSERSGRQVLQSSDRASYIESLGLIEELDFDVLVPWAATAGQPYHAVTIGRMPDAGSTRSSRACAAATITELGGREAAVPDPATPRRLRASSANRCRTRRATGAVARTDGSRRLRRSSIPL
jgi:hypothetical protein